MEKDILWDKKIGDTFKLFKYEQMDDFLDTICYASSYSATMYISDEQNNDNDLWNWLYSHEAPELNDSKREIVKWLTKSSYISDAQYDEKLNDLGKNTRVKVLIAGAQGGLYLFCSMPEYLNALRAYLSMEKKDEFVKALEECFPGLYFVPDIGSTINSLNRSFDDIKSEIVTHLSKLDEYNSSFRKMIADGKSYKDISVAFKGATSIDCSPQSDRDTTRNLKITLYNDLLQQEEEVNCELHTKFNKFNIDRTKQDRIYFSPGKVGIENGRVIIKYIGTHL